MGAVAPRRLVDVVVVYEIDRLTRALADFVRIVERAMSAKSRFSAGRSIGPPEKPPSS